MALYGLTRSKICELAKNGTVRARKEKPDCRSSRIVFRCSDVKEWMDNEAPKPRTEAFEPRRITAVQEQGKEGNGYERS
jgi:hypothetical protein